MTPADLMTALPEIALAAWAVGALLVGAWFGQDRIAAPIMWGTAALFLVMAMWVGLSPAGSRMAFNGLFINDAFARFAKIVILASAAAVMVMGQDYLTKRDLMRFEYPILITLATLGMLLMVSASDLIALYMGLELQSLALYVIAAMRRDSVKSTEAGLKYFILGSLASGTLLYGASITYGYAGTTQFAGILSTIADGDMPLGLLVGLVFLLAGLAFKISAVPFHMWTPDVYEGAPTPVTAFFATAPKVAAVILLTRLVHDAFGSVPGDWGQIVAFLAVASMFLGSITALAQSDIKRLMAYSSIAHMGFAMVGLAAGTAIGVQATMVYMAIYVVMNIGTFAFILGMERGGRHITEIASLNLYSRREPAKALALLILMFSMAGVPPLLGFFGKFGVLRAAVDADMTWLAIAGVLASVIGAYYYLRIVYLMYFGEEGEPLDGKMAPVPLVLLGASAVIMVVGVINLFGIEPFATTAATALVN
ncbi:NADH-quinone oxidoreductase subunit NuoN [Rhodobaculum claviforme]|uniref:NADH-quinone oxidoreductase subunit N n=1 Tax=Rhodobaculum claviforme TaxID=1549854 RepID=A0A934WK59_9RHOB|nr:NADH-quinone oxidoreductase subunit NuoN [Rhodobaculum claviforme]MBK5928771.1 NADH-quinone oxidoreductase subunit N [Rhodobaculum claviforme]